MKEEISFYNYAAIVKNLRGVIYWKGKGDLEWLLSRFRYRYLGVPPSLERIILKRKNLVLLTYPNNIILKVKELFSRVLIEEIAEVLCLASTYISPVMTDDMDDFRDLIVAEVKTTKELTDKDWKLHMRIADYTVLDFYTWSTNNAKEAIESGNVEEFLHERKEKIEKDMRRYWRIVEDEGRAFLAYVDPLAILHKYNLVEEFKSLGKDAFATMGILPVIFIHF